MEAHQIHKNSHTVSTKKKAILQKCNGNTILMYYNLQEHFILHTWPLSYIFCRNINTTFPTPLLQLQSSEFWLIWM